MLSPCGVPCWDRKKAGWKNGWQEFSQQSRENVKQRKGNVRAGNSEQTAESLLGAVRVLHMCAGCECHRGEVFSLHPDKSHLSGRLWNKT